MVLGACFSCPAIMQVDMSLWTFAWQNLRRRAAEAADTFFSADGSVSDDPLVIIAQRDACAACSFFKRVNRLSIAASVFVVSVCCTAFLRSQCDGCSRPLRCWLLVFTMLQLSQLPTRIVFLMKVLTAERRQANFQATVASITTSPAWQVSKKVSVACVGWLMLGLVWVLNSGKCTNSLYWLTVAVLLQTVLKTVLTHRIFISSFPDHSIEENDEATGMKAATQEQIAALPCCDHRKELFGDDGMSCAVCLDDFAEGESLRQLPCKHYFHCRCIDEWLTRSKRCPLCNCCIDAVK
eukprot:gnl/TRDRNA2_/TRDRNA2_132249_c0_seq1.p1 gnl/TRDRNA2_/TRDRNA2_132249_c0~~gnl/TRDRNA2_/TRDRNA2_132249_c0_seq1.p1  ORF type:complete len:295 (+),score=41.33 gnl/TRDRNA2_/TRDRNA2_132249_c0_seq1:75-959(+)